MRPAAIAVLLAVALAGCSSSSPPQITIGAARTYQLAGFKLSSPAAGKPQRITFRIDQPSGAPLTRYRTGSGPHTGVHLIIVRSDLGAIIHQHPKPQASGEFSPVVTFPTPGRYRVVVDVYPQLTGRESTLLGKVAEGCQTLASATDLEDFPAEFLERARAFRVEAGQLQPLVRPTAVAPSPAESRGEGTASRREREPGGPSGPAGSLP